MRTEEPFPVKSKFDRDIMFGKRIPNLVADKNDLRASGGFFLKVSFAFEVKRMIRSYSVKWLVYYFLFPWLQIR